MNLIEKGHAMIDACNHGLRTPGEEIDFTARLKSKSQSQIYRYGQSIFYLPHRHKISGFFVLCLHILGVRSPCMQSSQFRNSLVQFMCNADWNSLGKSKWHRFVMSVIIHTYICLNINQKRNALTYRWQLDQKEFHFGYRKIFFRNTGWKKEKKKLLKS